MLERNENQIHSSFIQTITIYMKKVIPLKELQTSKGIENILSSHQNVLFQYLVTIKHATTFYRQ